MLQRTSSPRAAHQEWCTLSRHAWFTRLMTGKMPNFGLPAPSGSAFVLNRLRAASDATCSSSMPPLRSSALKPAAVVQRVKVGPVFCRQRPQLRLQRRRLPCGAEAAVQQQQGALCSDQLPGIDARGAGCVMKPFFMPGDIWSLSAGFEALSVEDAAAGTSGAFCCEKKSFFMLPAARVGKLVSAESSAGCGRRSALREPLQTAGYDVSVRQVAPRKVPRCSAEHGTACSHCRLSLSVCMQVACRSDSIQMVQEVMAFAVYRHADQVSLPF